VEQEEYANDGTHILGRIPGELASQFAGFHKATG